MANAVVIGSGPNGLVAANLLADAGWAPVVLEAQEEPGGAVRSAEVTAPGFRSDLFSAFYPLGYASPVIRSLDLAPHGLRWRHAPLVLAHPLADGRCAALSRDVTETAAFLEEFAPGDGQRWQELHAAWERLREPLLDALFSPFPPLSDAARIAARLGPADAVRLLRFLLLPVRRMSEESFHGEGGGLLLAGNALHTDLGPEQSPSGAYGWLLAMLGQSVGYPVPEGGAGALTAALVRRLESRGGQVRCGTRVTDVVVRGGRAVAVRAADGTEYDASRAVLADVDAPTLFTRLVAPEALPSRLLHDLRLFQWDNPTVKVDWALSAPIPWTAEPARRAGTVHVGGDMDALSDHAHALALGRLPHDPFLIVGQMTTADPSRSPAGTESAWAYSHVPQTISRFAAIASNREAAPGWDAAESERYVERMEAAVERLAPGFRDLILARYVQGPGALQDANASLVGGAVNGGTAALHQQLIFRPLPGFGRAETPVAGLFLASSSAHPGGGVHGGPGAIAAAAALRQHGLRGRVARGAIRTVWRDRRPQR